MKVQLKHFIFCLFCLLFFSCKRELSCDNCREGNRPPVAHAGKDTLIILPTDSLKLDGSTSTDTDGSIVSSTWNKLSGPASSTIDKPLQLQTMVRRLAMGVYQFELEVRDNGGLSGKDTIVVQVSDALLNNQPPVARAGADQTILLPTNTAALNGSGSTDPDNNIIRYAWTKISGPVGDIATANALQTHVTSLTEGVYQFELEVTDAGGSSARDTVQVQVSKVVDTRCDTTKRPEIAARLVPIGKLSVARIRMAVATAGNKIVFAGGSAYPHHEYNQSSVVDVYDLTNKTWSAAKLTGNREGATAVANGNKIFFSGGGYWYGNYHSAVDIYDASSNTWSVAALSERKVGMAATAVGNEIMIAGGYSISWDTGSILSTIDVYDLVSNRWSIAHLSEARGYISAVTAKDKSYFAGGLSATTFSNTIDIYDKATNSWSVSQLKYVSGIVSGVLASDKIYWAGTGCNVEIWDVITGTSTRALLSKPRADRGFLYGDHVVLRNGSVAFLRGGLNFFDIFNIAAGTWVVGVLPEALPSNAAVICVNNIIYVAGGRDMNTATDQVYTLEF